MKKNVAFFIGILFFAQASLQAMDERFIQESELTRCMFKNKPILWLTVAKCINAIQDGTCTLNREAITILVQGLCDATIVHNRSLNEQVAEFLRFMIKQDKQINSIAIVAKKALMQLNNVPDLALELLVLCVRKQDGVYGCLNVVKHVLNQQYITTVSLFYIVDLLQALVLCNVDLAEIDEIIYSILTEKKDLLQLSDYPLAEVIVAVMLALLEEDYGRSCIAIALKNIFFSNYRDCLNQALRNTKKKCIKSPISPYCVTAIESNKWK